MTRTVLFPLVVLFGNSLQCASAQPSESPRAVAPSEAAFPHRADDPPPTTQAEVLGWPSEGLLRVRRPGDPTSPRAVSAVTGPDFDVYDHDAAVQDLVKDTGIDFVRPPRLEPSEAWRGVDGRDLRFTFAESRLGGQPAVVFLIISQKAGSDQFGIFAVETTRATFEAWGGAPRMMQVRGLIPTIDVFPAERRSQVARASLPQQVALYEAALDKLFLDLQTSAAMGAQARLLHGMRQLNYDLLFDEDISTSVLD